MTSKDRGDATGESVKIMARLKAATKACHSKLESLPYFKALIEHRLPLECYVNQLRALSVLHGVFENEILASSDKRASSVWGEELRKLPLLEEDLAFFRPRVIADAGAPIEAAHDMTGKIRLRGIEQPVTLLGYLYVLEGSTLGNSMHRPDVSATFHLDEWNGCRYYSSYQGQVITRWNRFSKKMNDTLNDPSVFDSVTEAALEAFSGLEALYAALYPLGKTEDRFHVTRINPEAGHHPIPQDEREIEAALIASGRGWDAFPYYAQRYGERGKRFSDSDTCWLVTLTALGREVVQRQIDWLCRVLAARGMPTFMMEQTLRLLYEELIRAVPDRAAAYEKLRVSADALRKKRESFFRDAAFQTLAGEFDQAVGPKMAEAWHDTGKLLVSAVADEKSGIEGALAALLGWMTDAGRFPDEWIHAVRDTARKANSHKMEGA